VDSSFDAIVVGAGVVGLACAAALAKRKRVLLLERHAKNATENSARNSGVVHAGLHHDDAWLRTTLCLRGRELLYRRCRLEDIPYVETGKLIVGDAGDEAALSVLHARARDRGIEAQRLDAAELRALEPLVRAERAVRVVPTGIVRTAALARSLEDECDARRVVSLRSAEVVGLEPAPGEGLRVAIEGARFVAPRVIVAAGLASHRLAALAGLDVETLGLRQHFVRGTWLALETRHRKAVSHLVYPLPEPDGLGIHLTRDIDGFLLAGPDAEWIDEPSFDLPTDGPTRAERFGAALARYLDPAIATGELHLLSTGVRPRISSRGAPPRDFLIADARLHGIAGLVVLAGIESPGLTACLAIAEEVEARLRELVP
jgi:L-2-hydroxyglutarate oxidase LhgO